MIKVVKDFHLEKVTMGDIYAKTIDELMTENANVMELEADLGICILGSRMKEIAEKHPNQLVNCGIQEANMVGVACGLSMTGKIPFTHSFAPFMSRRTNDQVFISGCYSKSNVRLVGSEPGIMAASNGGTHMPFEDIAVFRAFPELTIIEPTDSVMLENIMRQLTEVYGMFYIRTARKPMTKVYEEGSEFIIGKANIIREGSDATIIASGIMIGEALKAADYLGKKGISVRVVDMFTIKPIDEDMIIKCATETGAIITAENHNIINGLGSAVCDVIATRYPVPVEKVGVEDKFGEVGDVEDLRKLFKLTAKDIEEKVKKAISRK